MTPCRIIILCLEVSRTFSNFGCGAEFRNILTFFEILVEIQCCVKTMSKIMPKKVGPRVKQIYMPTAHRAIVYILARKGKKYIQLVGD